MGMIALIIIMLCVCVDNMVSANMSGMKMSAQNKNIFSIKVAFAFAFFSALLFGVGYGLSAVFFHKVLEPVYNWVGFSFILLLGLKIILESIEKSPSFNDSDVSDNRKLIRISSLLGLNFFLVGYALNTMKQSLFPQIIFLIIIAFAMTLLGFHLGSRNSKTVIGKRVELVAGFILVIMSVRLIII